MVLGVISLRSFCHVERAQRTEKTHGHARCGTKKAYYMLGVPCFVPVSSRFFRFVFFKSIVLRGRAVILKKNEHFCEASSFGSRLWSGEHPAKVERRKSSTLSVSTAPSVSRVLSHSI